jgi:hypothetical protein
MLHTPRSTSSMPSPMIVLVPTLFFPISILLLRHRPLIVSRETSAEHALVFDGRPSFRRCFARRATNCDCSSIYSHLCFGRPRKPTPSRVHVSDNGLPSLIDVNMLYSDVLVTARRRDNLELQSECRVSRAAAEANLQA